MLEKEKDIQENSQQNIMDIQIILENQNEIINTNPDQKKKQTSKFIFKNQIKKTFSKN